MYVCVYIFTCAQVWVHTRVCAQVCMQRPEANIECLPQALSTSESRSLEPGVHQFG